MKWSQKLDSSLKNKIGFMYVLEDIRSKSKILLDTVAKQIEFVNFPPDAWRMVNMRCLDSRLKSQPSVFTHKAALSTQAVWAPWVQRRPSEVLSVWSHNFESVWSQNLEQLELFVLTAGALAIVFGLGAHVEGLLLRGRHHQQNLNRHQ